MTEIITSTNQATPEWLTQTLQKVGVLPKGHITDIQTMSNAAFNSEIVHLRPSYSQDAPSSAPQALLLKLKSKHWGKAEVAFYQVIQNKNLSMFVHCFAVDYDANSGSSACLLDDLSDSHGPPITREQFLSGNGVPSAEHLSQIVDLLARFHAHWWEHPLLTEAEHFQLPPWFQSQQGYETFCKELAGQFDVFMNTESETFPADLEMLYGYALSHLPSLWQKHLNARSGNLTAMTLCHGDCYFSQFLCPIDIERHDSYLIDFDVIHPNVGPHDLVYLMPTFWTRVQRQEIQREENLLRQYHHTLQKYGLTNYSWADLLQDYRLNLIFMIFDPIWNQTDGSSKSYWWPKLQCLVSAYQDWECAELFG